MVVFEGIGVQVLTNSGLVPEYPDPVGAKKTKLNRYIEAQTGTSFQVDVQCGCQVFEEVEGVVCTLTIDGRVVDRVLLRDAAGESSIVLKRFCGVLSKASQDVRCGFVFAHPANGLSSTTPNEGLGTIAVSFHRVNGTKDLKASHYLNRTGFFRYAKSVAGTAQQENHNDVVAGYAPPKRIEPTEYYQADRGDVKWIDGRNPIFTINFLYGSTEVLQELEIRPPPPPPPRLEDRPLESLSRAELIELCQIYQKRSLCQCDQAKQEPPAAPRPAKRKREVGPMPDPDAIKERKRLMMTRSAYLGDTPRMRLNRIIQRRYE